VLGLSAEELHEVFAEWNKGELDSYLIEITADILSRALWLVHLPVPFWPALSRMTSTSGLPVSSSFLGHISF
jgi:hypothetical protein